VILYIDIETLPNPDYGEIVRPTKDELKCPKTLKKQDTIDAWWANPERDDELEEIYQKRVNEFRKTALDPWEGRIFCIAWALEETGVLEEDVRVLWDLDEKTLLENFEQELHSYERKLIDKMSVVTLVGYNIRNFDNTFLRLKSIKHKLKWLPQVFATRDARGRIEDVMEMAMITTRLTVDKYVSQDKVCKFFGLEGKGEITGANVYDYFVAGKYQEIADYCKSDVETVRTLYKLLR
jgi:3'-5' exonuclease